MSAFLSARTISSISLLTSSKKRRKRVLTSCSALTVWLLIHSATMPTPWLFHVWTFPKVGKVWMQVLRHANCLPMPSRVPRQSFGTALLVCLSSTTSLPVHALSPMLSLKLPKMVPSLS